MINLEDILKLSDDELISLINAKDEEQENLWDFARNRRKERTGNRVFLRGLVRFSNICRRDCQYCPDRNGSDAKRFQLTAEEILECLEFLQNNKINSVVLQSGEMPDDFFKEYLRSAMNAIKYKHEKINITLACGEMDYKFYSELNRLGVCGYLLKIATGNRELYRTLHPNETPLMERIRCLEDLKSAGYQVGTGNMIGLPEQTDFDIVADFRLLVRSEFDIFCITPMVMKNELPIATEINMKNWKKNKKNILNKTLNLVSMLRIAVPSANIALSSNINDLSATGEALGLIAGANMVFLKVEPNEENRQKNIKRIERKIKSAGMKPAYGKAGNSLRYYERRRGL